MSQMTAKKILIADDKANVRLLVSRALGQRFLVLEAQDYVYVCRCSQDIVWSGGKESYLSRVAQLQRYLAVYS